MLRAAAFAVAVSTCIPMLASAKTSDSPRAIGRALVAQHCGVCHTKPDLNAPQFGPSLDKTLFSAASEADIRKVISEGAPDMPGFALTLDAAQIDAIVDFIREAPPAQTKSAPAAAPSARAGGGDN